MPSLAAIKRVIGLREQPEIIHVYVPHMEYGHTHKHSLKRARQTHWKIRNDKEEPAYSSKKGSTAQIWAERLVSCLKRGPSNMNGYSFKQVDPDMTEIAAGVNFNPNCKYAAESLY